MLSFISDLIRITSQQFKTLASSSGKSTFKGALDKGLLSLSFVVVAAAVVFVHLINNDIDLWQTQIITEVFKYLSKDLSVGDLENT